MLRADDIGSENPLFAPRDRFDASHKVVLKSFDKGSLSVAQYRRDLPDLGITAPHPTSDVHMAVVRLTAFDLHDMWCDGRHIRRPRLQRGSISIYDFRRTWIADLRNPFHTVNFFIPRGSLEDLAHEFRAPGMEMLPSPLVEQPTDEVMLHLALALIPAFDRPREANRLFADHIAAAVAVHLACAYGGLKAHSLPHRGGLAPWQERRVKEMIADDLRGELGLVDLARACDLSVGHFARNFKKSTGVSPHQWLLEQRVARAKALLLDSKMPLRRIATDCGFADQSHLTRVFSRMVGATPAAWRRQKLD